MLEKKRYLLTRLAESDLHEARLWSLSRWGRKLTRKYFSDLHEAAEYVAIHHHTLSCREDLTGGTGLSIHQIREHYLARIMHECCRALACSFARNEPLLKRP